MPKPVGVFLREGKTIHLERCFGGRQSSCSKFWYIDFNGQKPWTEVSLEKFVGFGQLGIMNTGG